MDNSFMQKFVSLEQDIEKHTGNIKELEQKALAEVKSYLQVNDPELLKDFMALCNDPDLFGIHCSVRSILKEIEDLYAKIRDVKSNQDKLVMTYTGKKQCDATVQKYGSIMSKVTAIHKANTISDTASVAPVADTASVMAKAPKKKSWNLKI